MKIRTNDIETRYVIDGEGPWVTMSHSLACNLSMWDEQAKLLSRKFKVLRYDTRGHGGSSAPPGPYTLEQLADDAKALFDALGIQRTHPGLGARHHPIRLAPVQRRAAGSIQQSADGFPGSRNTCFRLPRSALAPYRTGRLQLRPHH